jgi:hypothetical protein
MDNRKLPPMPRFASEAEEAQWWFDHREELGQDLVAAMQRNGLGESSAMRRARKLREMIEKTSAA